MTTSQYEINNYLTLLDIPKSICLFTHNEIIKAFKQKNTYINLIINLINVKEEHNKLGHWIALKIDNKTKQIYIYTCYGLISEELLDTLIKYYHTYKYVFILSQVNQQNLKSSSCGYYSLRFLKEFEPDDLKELNYVVYNDDKNIISLQLNNEMFDINLFTRVIETYLKSLEF